MSAPTLIRKLSAGLLLLVFAFGITPKRTLHNIIASHKDGKSVARHDHPGACVSKAVFNCQCDNLVSESPFVAETSSPEEIRNVAFGVYKDRIAPYSPVAQLSTHYLRGPPAC